jgi:hypothetical protein
MPTPALLTRPCTAPNRSTAVSTAALHASQRVTSQSMKWMRFLQLLRAGEIDELAHGRLARRQIGDRHAHARLGETERHGAPEAARRRSRSRPDRMAQHPS